MLLYTWYISFATIFARRNIRVDVLNLVIVAIQWSCSQTKTTKLCIYYLFHSVDFFKWAISDGKTSFWKHIKKFLFWNLSFSHTHTFVLCFSTTPYVWCYRIHAAKEFWMNNSLRWCAEWAKHQRLYFIMCSSFGFCYIRWLLPFSWLVFSCSMQNTYIYTSSHTDTHMNLKERIAICIHVKSIATV